MLGPWISYGQSVFTCTPILRRFIVTGFCFGFHSPNTLEIVNIWSSSLAVSREYCHTNMLSIVKPTLKGDALYHSACKESHHPHLHMQTVITERGARRKELSFLGYKTMAGWDNYIKLSLQYVMLHLGAWHSQVYWEFRKKKKNTTWLSSCNSFLSASPENCWVFPPLPRGPKGSLSTSAIVSWFYFNRIFNPPATHSNVSKDCWSWEVLCCESPLSHFGQITARFEGLP